MKTACIFSIRFGTYTSYLRRLTVCRSTPSMLIRLNDGGVE